MLLFCILIIVIASALIVLACLTMREEAEEEAEEEESQKIDDLPVLAITGLVLQQCFPAKLAVPLLMEALGNA